MGMLKRALQNSKEAAASGKSRRKQTTPDLYFGAQICGYVFYASVLVLLCFNFFGSLPTSGFLSGVIWTVLVIFPLGAYMITALTLNNPAGLGRIRLSTVIFSILAGPALVVSVVALYILLGEAGEFSITVLQTWLLNGFLLGSIYIAWWALSHIYRRTLLLSDETGPAVQDTNKRKNIK